MFAAPGLDPALKRILRGFASGMSPMAEKIKEFLDLPDAELEASLPELVAEFRRLHPGENALAAEFTDALASAFGEQLENYEK